MKKVLATLMTLLVIFSIFSIFAPQAKATNLSPVGYWKFDEGSGTIANDSSGNGNTGTLMNGTLWVNGVSGKALNFDGVDDYVNVSDSDSLDIIESLRIEAWVKPDVNERLMNIVTKWWGVATRQKSYVLNIGGFPAIPYPRKSCFLISLDGSSELILVSNTDISVNAWTNITATYDGNHMKIYLNGTLDASKTQTGNIFVGTARLFVGHADDGSAYFFDGIIDEVKISGTPASPPVGGIYIPVDKLELLAPYIGLAILLVTCIVTIAYLKKRKRNRI